MDLGVSGEVWFWGPAPHHFGSVPEQVELGDPASLGPTIDG